MKLITKHTDYAVRSLLHLGRRGNRYTSSARIARSEKIPLPFLRSMAQRLIREGLVVSKEGVRGGLMLKKRLESIRLIDIIRIFQGNIDFAQCMFRKQPCSNRKTCLLRRHIQRVEKMVARELAGVTLDELVP